MRPSRTAGLTLMEVLIAVTLLSLLSVGILFAMRVGLDALGKANAKLKDNRRVAGAERILEQEIQGMMPVRAVCSADPQAPAMGVPFFEGEPQAMRLVSSYSLQEAWRGYPRILEFLVIPRDDGDGVRLVVNEILYTGPEGAGRLCLPPAPDPELGTLVPRYLPIHASPQSFVLADRLAYCRFSYQEPPGPQNPLPRWTDRWVLHGWPIGVRIDMASANPDASHLPVVPLTVPIQVRRYADMQYADQ